jgi:hypothetical protein
MSYMSCRRRHVKSKGNDDVDHAYSNVMMKMFWWWYDYDQDDQDNYDQVDDNDMMIWWWLYTMYILINTWATWAVEGGMSNQKVFINDDDNAYDYVDDEWWCLIHIIIYRDMSSRSRCINSKGINLWW